MVTSLKTQFAAGRPDVLDPLQDERLSLAAKVQGENGTVESKLVLKVLP